MFIFVAVVKHNHQPAKIFPYSMIMIRRLLPLLFVISTGFCALGQVKSVGIPSIINHSRISYNASNQNWAITQSPKGFIYFGNNDGVLEYDGTAWRTFPASNLSVIRSVLAIGDTIYFGAFEEIGYLAASPSGELVRHSLNHLVPPAFANFGEIWNIFKDTDRLVFQSFNYIFIFKNGQIQVLEPLSKFSLMHSANNQYYVVDVESGLMRLKGDSLELVSIHPIFFRNEIRCILPFANELLLIGTSNEGLFLFNSRLKTVEPWRSEVNNQIIEHNLFSAIRMKNGFFAIGTVSNGIYISNEKGQIHQHLNRYKGLQNNTILTIFEDKRNNLWLGLDNGIDYLEVSSPLSFLNYNYNIESAYASIVHNGILYVGTNQGLFAREYSRVNNFSTVNQGFQLIKGTEGQVWSLEVLDNTLFCGHNYGCFVINGFNAKQISDIRGFWSFIKPRNAEGLIIAGTYTGLIQLSKQNGQWSFRDEVKGFEESSRSMYLDSRNSLWVSHGYRGLFKLQLTESFDSVTNVQLFRGQNGLPESLPYNIQVVNNSMLITAQDGVLRYNYSNNTFEPATDVNSIFLNKGFIDKIHQDRNGNLWYFTNEYLGLMRLLENGVFVDIVSPFSMVNDALIPAFQNIYIYDPHNVFIGSQKGLIHYEPSIRKDNMIAENVFIKEASFYGKQSINISRIAYCSEGDKIHQVGYSHNSVTFRYTSPAFERPEKTQFSYRLKGFDHDWSVWDRVNFKEYTNLREGDYEFQVKAINAFGAESDICSFLFTIKPPFLRSKVAYILYAVALALAIVGNFYYLRKRILKARLREKLKQEKRLAQREKMFKEQTALSEKEIMHLRNESLKNEMKFKNKELANATLHLIQKNKTLTYLKEDLGKLLKNIPSESAEKHNVNSLLKKINRDLRNEKNWELFNNYFDEVHQDFIARLKDKFPDLSPKELRLCAYLRMNISTKEIAPLMNISVRGVEISRYRLRKKLNLDHKTNLTDFFISF